MLDLVEIEAKEKAIGSIIWLHGLGASGDDFAPIVPHMQLPDVRFVFPHAPMRPVTIHGGMETRAWFDITTLEPSPKRESLTDILRSQGEIEALIDREIERGIPSQNIVLMGFSQGAAMALHVGHRYHQRLLAVVVMSGYLLSKDTFAIDMHEANRYTPFHFYHGTRDLVVLHRRGVEACDNTVEQHRFTHWTEYPVGHEVCLEQIRQIRFLLHKEYTEIRKQQSASSIEPK